MEREEPEFSWSDVVVPEDVEIRVRANVGYRTCDVCGGDCIPEVAGADRVGARIALVCPEHGLHRFIDPFEHLR